MEVNHLFTDPQSVTINAVPHSMPRILSKDLKATYSKNDETVTMTISHQPSNNGRTRSQVRLDQRKIVTNPLDSSTDYDTLSFYFVLDRPSYGFSQVEVELLIAGLKTWLDNTAIGKIYGKES